jgi:hypothetical protein
MVCLGRPKTGRLKIFAQAGFQTASKYLAKKKHAPPFRKWGDVLFGAWRACL